MYSAIFLHLLLMEDTNCFVHTAIVFMVVNRGI